MNPAAVQNLKAKPSALAILFSAVVFPGAGQYLQKRWLAGSFYALVFLGGVVFLFAAIFRPLFLNLRMLSALPAGAEENVFYPTPWKNIFFWTSVALGVYLANLLDVYVYYRRGLTE